MATTMPEPVFEQGWKKNALNAVLYIFCGAGGMVLAALMFWEAFKDTYPELSFLASGLILAAMSVFMFYLLWQLKRFKVDSDSLVFTYLVKRPAQVLRLADIKNWSETARSDKYGTWKELQLYTETQSVSISSKDCDGYEQVKAKLTKNKPQIPVKITAGGAKNQKLAGAALFMIALLFFFLSANRYTINAHGIPAADIITISDKVQWTNGNVVRLSNNGKFEFVIRGNHLPVPKLGDSVSLDILNADYQKKITGAVPLGFFDKTIAYRSIIAFGLKYNNQSDNWRMGIDIQMKKNALTTSLVFIVIGCVPLFLAWILLYKPAPSDIKNSPLS